MTERLTRLWAKYWQPEWAATLDRFRVEVGDDGYRMWALARPLCANHEEKEVIRYAIECVCGMISERPEPRHLRERRLPTDVHPLPPEPSPRFEVFTGAAHGGGSRRMTQHAGALPTLDQQERASLRKLTMRSRKRSWYDDWRRIQQRAY